MVLWLAFGILGMFLYVVVTIWSQRVLTVSGDRQGQPRSRESLPGFPGESRDGEGKPNMDLRELAEFIKKSVESLTEFYSQQAKSLVGTEAGSNLESSLDALIGYVETRLHIASNSKEKILAEWTLKMLQYNLAYSRSLIAMSANLLSRPDSSIIRALLDARECIGEMSSLAAEVSQLDVRMQQMHSAKCAEGPIARHARDAQERDALLHPFLSWIHERYANGSREYHSTLVKQGLKLPEFKKLKEAIANEKISKEKTVLRAATEIAYPYGCVRGIHKKKVNLP